MHLLPRLAMDSLFCISWSLLFVLVSFPSVSSLNFSFNFTGSNGAGIAKSLDFEGDASPTDDGIQLTKNSRSLKDQHSTGRVLYPDLLRLLDSSGNLISFTTHFSFRISRYDSNTSSGDGLALFLAPSSERLIPGNSDGENLGLFNSSGNQVVAVEFDTYHNNFDPQNHHIGIDVYSIKSLETTELLNFSFSNGTKTAHATVNYDGGATFLSAFLAFSSDDPSVNGRRWIVSTRIDLKSHLPEEVAVGFSSTTGSSVELHTLLSWNFTSTEIPTTGSPASDKHNSGMRLRLGIIISLLTVICMMGFLWFVQWQRWHKQRQVQPPAGELQPMFDQQRGPRSFAYQELVEATNNFAEERKLGSGGFGVVYKGILPGRNNLHVAIKKISRESMQGEKEYMAEVILFSQLRHRNLVQLIGYCHEAEDFLLIYQYMPNRSLDRHLYSTDKLLGWAERHKIAVGLASALLYLHEEWEQCVVHRDVKPSNVMLDNEFNAKLGDFGLARLMDHDRTAVSTELAGTKGYIAPEYEKTGKARKESDVFSFGMVVLEIACGRKPIVYAEEPERINLAQWVWRLYEKGACVEAADRRLGGEFDEQAMERLMVVGLWCAHPDHRQRPSIRRATGVLSSEAPQPDLRPLGYTASQEVNNHAASPSSSGGQSLNTISRSSYVSGR